MTSELKHLSYPPPPPPPQAMKGTNARSGSCPQRHRLISFSLYRNTKTKARSNGPFWGITKANGGVIREGMCHRQTVLIPRRRGREGGRGGTGGTPRRRRISGNELAKDRASWSEPRTAWNLPTYMNLTPVNTGTPKMTTGTPAGSSING